MKFRTHRQYGLFWVVVGAIIIVFCLVVSGDLVSYIVGAATLATGVALAILGNRIDDRYRQRLQRGGRG